MDGLAASGTGAAKHERRVPPTAKAPPHVAAEDNDMTSKRERERERERREKEKSLIFFGAAGARSYSLGLRCSVMRELFCIKLYAMHLYGRQTQSRKRSQFSPSNVLAGEGGGAHPPPPWHRSREKEKKKYSKMRRSIWATGTPLHAAKRKAPGFQKLSTRAAAWVRTLGTLLFLERHMKGGNTVSAGHWHWHRDVKKTLNKKPLINKIKKESEDGKEVIHPPFEFSCSITNHKTNSPSASPASRLWSTAGVGVRGVREGNLVVWNIETGFPAGHKTTTKKRGICTAGVAHVEWVGVRVYPNTGVGPWAAGCLYERGTRRHNE
eukprot:gene10712-7443_t